MRVSQVLNKIKMNLGRPNLVEVENTKLTKRILDFLVEFNLLQQYKVSPGGLILNLSKHKIRTLKGQNQFLKYTHKELDTYVKNSLSKNQGKYIMSCSAYPFIMSHETALEQGIGGLIIGYVE